MKLKAIRLTQMKVTMVSFIDLLYVWDCNYISSNHIISSVIIFLNNEIVNGNCSAVIEDVLDIIDVPQVQVYIRGSDHHHHHYSSSSSSSSKSRRYWKRKSFRGYHKRSTSDDYGWRRNKHGRWWHKKRSKGRSRSRSSMDGYRKKKMWWWAKVSLEQGTSCEMQSTSNEYTLFLS